jgi:hypothetical protein
VPTERLIRYVVLDVRRVAGVLELEYTDSAGRATPGFNAMVDAIRELTRDLKPQVGPYQTGVSPLAVFVRGESIDGQTLRDVEKVLEPFIDLDLIQLVALPDREWTPREFDLPLDVGYTSRRMSRALTDFRSHDWARLPDVKRYGLRVHKMSERSTTPADVVFVDDADEARKLAALPPEQRPRLIVAGGFELPASDPLARSTSWLYVPEQRKLSSEFVNDILYGVVHDQPLHEVLKSASRKPNAPRDAYLAADPASVNDLRMWDALQTVAHQGMRIESRTPQGSVTEAVGNALGRTLSKKMTATLEEIDVSAVTNILRGNFQRERDALVPMAEMRAKFEKARRTQHKIGVAAGKSAKVRKKLSNGERRVDVTLMRTEPDPDRGVFVETTHPLVTGERYQLSVLIGQPVKASLVVGEVPPIDPLLPPPPDDKGHLLHVVVYPLDFGPSQPIIRRLILPSFGSSEPVTFEVTAPATAGKARLRIAVYYDTDLEQGDDPSCYHNHLVQSFLLDALVLDPPQWMTDQVTVVKLEFSRTSAFTNLGQLDRRIASIAVNSSNADTHTLMMKEGGTTASLGVSEQMMQKQLEVVRESLFNASTMTGTDSKLVQRFKEGAEHGPEFETTIRDLADKGRELHRRIFSSGLNEVQDVLRTIVRSVDEVVQVVRLQDDFYFPWTLLFDYPVPERITGQPDKPVCDGFQRKHPDGRPFTCRDCVDNCLYPGLKKEDAYCVYGFWGTRLQVEQSLHQLGKNEEATKELKPFGKQSILYVSGLTTKSALAFPEVLEQDLGKEWIGRLPAGSKLVQQLWSEQRPAVLVVLGHLQVKDADDQPKGARIRITDDDWLMANRVTDNAFTAGRWDADPRTVIILAACESAATDLLSMNDFIKAFGSARAGAVIGTETSVFETLARRFARTLSKALLDRRKLGEAILDFRRELLRERNPLGLLFTAFGHAGLQRADGAQS